MKHRNKLFFEEEIQKKITLSPQQYSPKNEYVSSSRFKNIGIGIGYGYKMGPINKALNNFPGVGQYNIPSSFDLKRRSKLPIN